MMNSPVSLAFVAVAMLATVSQSLYLEKRMGSHQPHQYMQNGPRMDPKKRPFCNAFTGCGRKRSDLPAMMPELQEPVQQPIAQQEEMENLGSLLDLSAEPAVEDLSRQIMSEAKLWEAIQEANVEIMRQRQEQQERQQQEQRRGGGQDGDEGGQQHQTKCTSPSCMPGI